MALKIDALKLLDGPVTVDLDEPIQALDGEEDPACRFLHGMAGRVVLSRMIDKVLLRGTLATRIQARCVRCLDLIELPIHTEVTLVYAHDPDGPGAA